jgi:phytoene dehydrogenase-like protein
VLVLEAAAEVGGAARTRQLVPGASVSSCAHLLHAMPADLIRDLALDKQGFALAATRLKTFSLSESGQTVVFDADSVTGTTVPAADSAALVRFNDDMQRFARALQPVFDKLAPELAIENTRQRLELIGLGWTLRRMGRARMREFLRIIGKNFYDLLDEYFENPQLKAAIAMDALLGAEWGARSMGSVLTYLYRLAGYERGAGVGIAVPAGGMGALTQAIAAVATAAGADIRCASRVTSVLIENDKACGVVLDSGETLYAERVISNADPKQTFLKLVAADHLDTGFVRRIRNLRSSGKAGKLHLVLDALPLFKGVAPGDLGARLR